MVIGSALTLLILSRRRQRQALLEALGQADVAESQDLSDAEELAEEKEDLPETDFIALDDEEDKGQEDTAEEEDK
jgi:transcription termination factor NusB